MENLIRIVAACLFTTAYAIAIGQNTYVLAVENPFSPVSVSHVGAPALGDIDADGDLDLFVGQYNSNDMLFYRNTGTSQEPVYESQTGANNPLDVYTSNSGCNGPVLVDIDNDGDLDVFVGIWSYLIRHLQNQGDAMSPNFVFQFGVDNPLNQVFTEGICSYPAFIDIDADLDYDVFITDGNGNIDFYENVGDQSAPVFELDSVHNVLGHVSLSEATKIVFHDVSGDGLQDAVISHGVNAPELLYFENTGTAQNPVFEQRTGVSNPFDGITDMEALVPVFADIDDDGDDDLILGTWGRVLLYEAVQISDVSDITGQRGHRVYPNPSSGMITASGEGVDVVEAMDESGRVIRRSTTKWNTITMDLTGEAPGFYFVRMIGSAGVTVHKIILL
jgi:hypothetical protein